MKRRIRISEGLLAVWEFPPWSDCVLRCVVIRIVNHISILVAFTALWKLIKPWLNRNALCLKNTVRLIKLLTMITISYLVGVQLYFSPLLHFLEWAFSSLFFSHFFSLKSIISLHYSKKNLWKSFLSPLLLSSSLPYETLEERTLDHFIISSEIYSGGLLITNLWYTWRRETSFYEIHIHVIWQKAKIFDKYSLVIVQWQRARERTMKEVFIEREKRVRRTLTKNYNDQREIERKERDNSLALPHIQSSTSFFSNGSQARLFTASCGSFKPRPVAVPWRRISRLSRMSRLRWRVPLFLSEKVAIILGSSHLMLPLHSLACFEMPEMLASGLFDVTSLACCPMRARKETRVWPMYLRAGLHEQDCSYTPFKSRRWGRVLLLAQRRLPRVGPGLVW